MGRNIRKSLIMVIASIIAISIIFFIGLQIMLSNFSKEVSKIEISDIDILTIDDGVYMGKYFINESVGAIVEVTVKDNKIININFLEHKYGRGKKAEAITDAVIKKQSLDVDAISGATGSSIVILKAIENALNIIELQN